MAPHVGYNPNFRQFTVSTGDYSLMASNPHQYSVTSELMNYPGHGMKTA
jgi:hypothetical protein